MTDDLSDKYRSLHPAAAAVAEDVCSLLCPSAWKTADGPPSHHPKCIALHLALREVDEAVREANIAEAIEAEDRAAEIANNGQFGMGA